MRVIDLFAGAGGFSTGAIMAGARFVVVENVYEFLDWSLYPAWKLAMESLGYAISENLLDAADHAVPQHRKRLFLICSQSRHPLELRMEKKPHRPAAPHIQWDYPKWSPIQKPGRSQATLERVRNGRKLYGDRFVMPYYGSGSGKTGRSIQRPIGTITTRDRWAVVDGDRMRMLQPPEYRDLMGFPKNYLLPFTRKEAIHMLGNAVCPPVARDIIQSLKKAA